MKNNLGNLSSFLKVFFIQMLLFVSLSATEDFTYAFSLSKQNPYVKEAVILTLDLNQTNPDKVLLFNFDIEKSDSYTFQRLDVKITDTYHNAKVHYIYLLYPLKSGDINITFNLLKKVTSDESVAYGFSGDKEINKKLVTVDTAITLPSLVLNVKPLPENTDLVGDFTLTHQAKKHQAKAYEPLPFQVSLKGLGYPPSLDTLLPKDVNFTYFTDEPIMHSVASPKGIKSTVIYPMALSHNQSFTLPPITLKGFNPLTEQSYILTIPVQYFDIEKVDVGSLIDKIDSPKALQEDWSWFYTLLEYLVVFGAGYLAALSWKWNRKKKTKESSLLSQKIQNCKEPKCLLQVLMAADSKRFSASIAKLESSLYRNGKISFNKVKQEAIEESK